MLQNHDILFEVRRTIALVTLNRPHALNALDLGMIRALAAQLGIWRNDASVTCIVIRANGDRAFCAGGDVRAAWDAIKMTRSGDTRFLEGTSDYFREEYVLNAQLKRFKKPVIALIDGLTMGGGVGLAVHNRFCVATERTQWAMPEMAIGFMPDIGSSYVLSRLPDATGIYLALTGRRIGAPDCLSLGLASHIVPSASLPALIETLVEQNPTPDDIAQLITNFSGSFQPALLPSHRAEIAAAFSLGTMEDILAALTAQDTEWARQEVAGLGRMSPTSLRLALRLLKMASSLSLEDCLQWEYRLSQACIDGHDFFEGVRAQLVDKDRDPKWNPSSLSLVTPQLVERHFSFPVKPLIFEPASSDRAIA
jgi:enoyl-CoA hydratase